ncbi:MAG: hypothetical protein MUP63_03045 [Candidatus Nanohaloarchaeota archaeon QJJ-7]|nr:hypothetical protein [Candidatus Nanohaloarchaeota archaeon QJJ-7]
MSDEISFEDIYTGEDLNVEGVLHREADSGWSPTLDIDWSQTVDLSEEKKSALADAATQFHYSNSSHLILCGRLLETAESMELKKLSLYLAFSKMRNVDVFGRYLGKVSSDTEIAPHTKEFLSEMSGEENLVNLLLGMGVLGGTVGYGVLDYLRESGDPLFREISDRVIEKKKTNEEMLVRHLNDFQDSGGSDAEDSITEHALFYRDRAEKIVLFHGDLLTTLGFDPEEVADNVVKATDEFYEKIGLDPEELG